MSKHLRKAFDMFEAARPASGFRPETPEERGRLLRAQEEMGYAVYRGVTVHAIPTNFRGCSDTRTVPHEQAANPNPRIIRRRGYKADDFQRAWFRWIHQLADWSWAATVTFRRHVGAQSINRGLAEAALRHKLRVLDVICFGKNRVKRGSVVQSAVVLGWGTYGQHPHAHLALATPPGMSDADLAARFEEAARHTEWLNQERVVRPYTSAGWAEYMVGHGPENLVLSLLRPEPATELRSCTRPRRG
ncbi:MAG: hypothetical protein ACO3P1_10955 [Pseudomonadales bacterium]